MAIEGDIDLTEKLDFRVDKKEKLLPSVSLIKYDQKPMKSIAEQDLREELKFYPSYSDNETWVTYTYIADNPFQYYNTIDIGTTTISNITASPPSEVRLQRLQTTVSGDEYWTDVYNFSFSYNTPIFSSTSNSNVSTRNIKYSYTYNAIEDFSLNGKREKDHSINGKCYYIENFTLGDKRLEVKSDAEKIFSDTYRDEEDDYSIPEEFMSWYYDEEDDDNYGNMWFSSDPYDNIPWFDTMKNSRIRKDYIDSLYEKEQDFDSYLTDYNWLRLRD